VVNKITSVFSKDGEKTSDLKRVLDVYKKHQEAKKKLLFLDEKEKRLSEQREELLEVVNHTDEELVKILDSKVLLSGNDFYTFVKDNFEKIVSNDLQSFEKLFYNFICKKESKNYDESLTEEYGEITSDGHIQICPDPDNCDIHSFNKKSMLKFKIKLVR
jgi:hypothetical protein